MHVVGLYVWAERPFSAPSPNQCSARGPLTCRYVARPPAEQPVKRTVSAAAGAGRQTFFKKKTRGVGMLLGAPAAPKLYFSVRVSITASMIRRPRK